MDYEFFGVGSLRQNCNLIAPPIVSKSALLVSPLLLGEAGEYHEALASLLHTVRECERDWELCNRIDLALRQ